LRLNVALAFAARGLGACLLAVVAVGSQPHEADAQLLKRINTHLANESFVLESGAGTVNEFLGELSLRLPHDALIEPSREAALQDGMSVSLVDTTVTRGEETEVIPAPTEIKERWRYGAAGLEVTDPGVDGLQKTSYTLFFYRGEEVGRRTRTQVLRKMEPRRVTAWKTLVPEDDGPTIQQILERRARPSADIAPPTRYKAVLTMKSSAYEPGPTSCGPGADGATSCGYRAGYGVVAVDPNVIPYHTRLFIEGYGYAIAGDCGGAIDGNDIDLGFMTVDECMAWGRRDVRVYILY
jgi:3D (Asp-Asp-Asp) domain-containing protein